jgi:glucose/arabinose dehydrogenase
LIVGFNTPNDNGQLISIETFNIASMTFSKFFLCFIFFTFIFMGSIVWMQMNNVSAFPSLVDPNLEVEKLASGLTLVNATSMQFVDSNNILVLERNGDIRLITNGSLIPNTVLSVPVDNQIYERGLLGIAIANGSQLGPSNNVKKKVVFLHYTESPSRGTGAEWWGEPRNRVYRFDWNGEALENRSAVLDLAAFPGPGHVAGKLLIGPDGYLYVTIGDLMHRNIYFHPPFTDDLYDTGVILRINATDSLPAEGNPLSFPDKNRFDRFVHGHPEAPSLDDRFRPGENPVSRWYALGIRNSFGIDFDPLTGAIWDTENGDYHYDELNIVSPGFDSGWIAHKIMGPSQRNPEPRDHLNVTGSKYADPVFSWNKTIGVTDIEFMRSSNLGKGYENNIFVGDYHNGALYYFQVNADRTGVVVNKTGLEDSVADDENEVSAVTFGRGFHHITDLETGPDGLLYVLTYGNNGTIFKIGPSLHS